MAPRLADATLRDANQSLAAGRMGAGELAAVASRLDRAGLASVEVFGGCTFENHLRLGIDPWGELDRLAEATPTTARLALVRGQSLVGRRSFADDAVDLFLRVLVQSGIGIVRLYDPLNDVRNLEVPARSARAAGAAVQGALCYATGPAHDLDAWCALGRSLERLGAEAVVVMDPAGLLSPRAARELVTALAGSLSVPVGLHLHCGGGMASMACLAAAEAGVGLIDVALSPLAGGPSLPSAEALAAALAAGGQETGADLERLTEASRELEALVDRHREDLIQGCGEAEVLLHRLPGALIAALRAHLDRHNAGSRMAEALTEVVRIREELGQPPLVAPFWQMIADQAVFNVLGGERYQTVTQELKDYLQGLYGRPPQPADPGVRRLVLGHDEPITVRPADLLEPQVEAARGQLGHRGLPADDRDVLTYLMFPALATDLFRARSASADSAGVPVQEGDGSEGAVAEADAAVAEEPAEEAVEVAPPTAAEFDVEVEGEVFRVRVTGAGLTVAPMPVAPVPPTAPTPTPSAPRPPRDGAIKAPMQGLIVKVPVSVGDRVGLGDVVAVLEAMKMQNDIVATQPGTVLEVYVKEGDVVSPDQPLVALG